MFYNHIYNKGVFFLYLWNINALVKDLKEDKVSEKEKLKYYLLTSSISFLSMAFPSSVTLFTILVIGVFIIGTFLCFNVNSKGDNRNFIDRVFCLGVPLTIRLSLIFSPTSFIVFCIFYKTDYSEQSLQVFTIFFMIIYYLFLKSYFSKVSQSELPIQGNNISAN